MKEIEIASGSLEIRCFGDLAQVREAWHCLEAQGAATTIYQSWDWVSAWHRHLISSATGKRAQVVIVEVLAGEHTVALLPMMIRREKGVRILSWLGDSHFNFPGGLFQAYFLKGLDRASFQRLWRRIGKALPAYDVAWFTSQLPQLDDADSPMQWLHRRPSPNSAHRLVFEHHDWQKLLTELRSRSTRKRMRNEESRLSREGEVVFEEVNAEQEIDAAVDAVFRQRERRFRALGIPLEPRMADYQRFYRSLLQQSLHAANPSSRFYLLLLKLDGELLASLLIAEKDGVVYPLINSMTTSRYSRWSPGDYLLRHLIADACERNMVAIDFGLAEDSSYKTAWCNRRVEIYETIHGNGLYGKAVAFVIIGRTTLARRIKQSPRAWAWYQFFRSLKTDGVMNSDWKNSFQKLLRATHG